MNLLDEFHREQSRYILWLPIFFMGGILAYFSLMEEPILLHIVIPFLILILCFCLFFKNMYGRYFILLLLFFHAGFSNAYFYTHTLDTYLLKEKLEDFAFTATVDETEYNPSTQKYKVTLTLKNPNKIKRIKVTHNGKTPLDIGDTLTATATLLPFSDPASAFSYDFRQNAYFNGISASGTIRQIDHIVLAQENSIKKTRQRVTQFIREKLSGQVAEVAIAVTTGFRSGITQETRQDFANSGLSHILAISGLHISLVAGLLFLLMRRFLGLIPAITKRYNTKKWACLFSIPATYYYVALSGYGYPSIRAFCMTSLIFLSVMLDRFALSMRSIALAAFVILLLFPQSALSVSFQLSFAAVLGLIAFYEQPWRILQNHSLDKGIGGKIGLYVLGVCMTTLIATLATTPISIFYFNQFTFNAVFANMLAIPLTGFFIMPLAMVCVITSFVGDFQFLFDLWGITIQALIHIAAIVSSWKGSFVTLHQPSTLYIALFGLGFIWLCLFRTKVRYIGLVMILLSPLTFFDTSHLPDLYIDKSVMGYKENGFFMVSHLKKGSFLTSQWAQEQGVRTLNRMPLPANKNGISLLFDPWDHPKITACPHKIITNGYIRKCRSNIIIDRSHLKDKGTHLVWLNPFKIQTIKDLLGHRPWTVLSES
ncbi:MAG: hypothetical protein HEEMFOPI_01717 [Holosporales bacterium]